MFVLRSKSPRRIQILSDLGIQFNSIPAELDESSYQKEEPLSYLERICRAKAFWNKSDDLALGLDTIVVFQNEVLQKPLGDEEAMDMLRRLSGELHFVYSGGCFFESGNYEYFWERTEVIFHNWEDLERERYLRNYKPFDKAGSYGIQDPITPVKEWKGSYLNVVGFPIRSFYERANRWKKYWS